MSAKSLFGTLALLLVIALAALAGAAAYELNRPLEVATGSAEVRVPSGASARSIARQLREAGVPLQDWQFVAAATLSRATRALRPGRYRIEGSTSILALVDKFRRGDFEREQLTVLEGSTFFEMRAVLARSADLRHDTGNWTDAQILHAVKCMMPVGTPETFFDQKKTKNAAFPKRTVFAASESVGKFKLFY